MTDFFPKTTLDLLIPINLIMNIRRPSSKVKYRHILDFFDEVQRDSFYQNMFQLSPIIIPNPDNEDISEWYYHDDLSLIAHYRRA